MILEKFKEEVETEKKEQEKKDIKLRNDLCAYLGCHADIRIRDSHARIMNHLYTEYQYE